MNLDSQQLSALAAHIQGLTEAVRALSERTIAGEIHGRHTADTLAAVKTQLEALRSDLAPLLHEHAQANARKAAYAELALEQDARSKAWHDALSPIRSFMGSPVAVSIITAIVTGIASLVLGHEFSNRSSTIEAPTVLEQNSSSSLHVASFDRAHADAGEYAGD